jgi:hypothetical protein
LPTLVGTSASLINRKMCTPTLVPPVAVLFDNLQRIAPVVKKVGRKMRLSY